MKKFRPESALPAPVRPWLLLSLPVADAAAGPGGPNGFALADVGAVSEHLLLRLRHYRYRSLVALRLALRQQSEMRNLGALRPRTASLAPPGGPLLRSMWGGRGKFDGMAVSAARGLAVTSSRDGDLQVWSVNDGFEIRTLAIAGTRDGAHAGWSLDCYGGAAHT